MNLVDSITVRITFVVVAFLALSACERGSLESPLQTELSPSAIAFGITPTSLDFGASKNQLSLSIKNSTSSALYWDVGTSSNWIKFSESDGRIEAGATETIAVSVSRAGLPNGTYRGAIEVRSLTGSTTIPAILKVDPSTNPSISIVPSSLDFGDSRTELSFRIQNGGGSALDWTAGTSSGWVDIGKTAGRIPAGSFEDVSVQVSRSGVASGTYSGSVNVVSNGGFPLAVVVRMEARSGPTVNVRDFGARGDGVSDDARAFEAALSSLPSSGGTVFIPGGTYSMGPIHASPLRPLDLSKVSNVTIAGEGMGLTTLKLEPGTYPSATFMILVLASSDITIRDLTLDMNRNQSSFGDEQSHGIRVVSSSGVAIDRVRFQSGPGDGVYLLGVGEIGEPWTEQVRVENSEFKDLWRNGVTVQRGVQDVMIRTNTFEGLGDQAVSVEPSGSGSASRRITVEANYVRHSNANWAIAMSGTRRDEFLQGLTFRNNTIENGSAYFLRAGDVKVTGNRILGDRWHPTLRLENVNLAVVSDNFVAGVKSNNTEGVVQILNEEGALTSNVTLKENQIQANPNSTGIHVRDARTNITITDNTLTGSDSKKGILIDNFLTTGSKRTNFTVSNNIVQNFEYGILIGTRGDTYSSVYVLSNSLSHNQQPSTSTVGIVFSLGTDYQSIVQVLYNSFGTGILRSILNQ
jgi:polygalacturonase